MKNKWENKSSEGRFKCTITAQGSSTFTAQYFINGSMYYIPKKILWEEIIFKLDIE